MWKAFFGSNFGIKSWFVLLPDLQQNNVPSLQHISKFNSLFYCALFTAVTKRYDYVVFCLNLFVILLVIYVAVIFCWR